MTTHIRGDIFPDTPPELVRAIRIVQHHPLIVANVGANLRAEYRIDRGVVVPEILAQANVVLAFIRRKESSQRKNAVIDPVVLDHRAYLPEWTRR